MMAAGNSTDNVSQEVLKAESGNSFDVVLDSAGLSSSPERPLEDCLHFEGCGRGEDGGHRSSTGCHLRSATDGKYGDVDDSVVSLPDGGECADEVNGLRNVRKLLMHQIKSFIMDPDIYIFSKSPSHLDDSSLRQGVQNNELNMEMKEVTELPLEIIFTADSGILETEAIISKSQSYNHPNTAVDCGKSEHSNYIMTGDWCNCTSESENNLFEFDVSKGKFGDEREDFDSVLQLLLRIRDICFEDESLSKQENVDIKQFEGFEERNHLTAEHPEAIDDASTVTAATLPSNDSPDKNSGYVKEHVRSLWKQINEFFERKQFSSAVILRQHLETVEKIKSETDLRLQRQQDSKRNSEGFPDDVKFENTKVLEQFIVRLSTNSMTRLSDKLIQWQDFNEIRADLGYELAKEQDSLESIAARINSENASLDAGHDLKLVEEMENSYCKRLINLRRCNGDLEGLLDDKTRENHRSQLGTLANQLQYIKMSCSRLRKRLDLPCLPLTNDCLQSGEQKEGCHSVYSQTDDDDDNDVEVPASVSLLKMLLLLLMLIVLFSVVFFFFLEPRWYNQVNSFRLPVLYHLRHVGTFPPV